MLIGSKLEKLPSLPVNGAKIWLRRNLHRKIEFRNYKEIMLRLLNTIAIASSYAGRDPQGEKAIEAFR